MDKKKFHPGFLVSMGLGVLISSAMACNFAARILYLPTRTPVPSSTPTLTLTPQPTLTPALQDLSKDVYIPDDCQGRPLATQPVHRVSASPTPTFEPNPPISKQMQLKVLDQLTSDITTKYLYPDYNGVDWPALSKAAREKIKAGLDTPAFYNEMENLVAALGDQHSQYQSPVEVESLNSELSGHLDFVGLGILVTTVLDRNLMTVMAVFPGSPAEHAGLKAHDNLLSVDGLPLVEGGVPYNFRIRGPECSAVVVTVQSQGEEPRQIMIIRHHITEPLRVEARLIDTQDGSKIGYIFIPSFYDETIPDQIQNALQKLGNLDGLVLDNRQNGGGAGDVVERIISFFAKGTVGNYELRNNKIPFTVKAHPVKNSQEVPLVVLVGEDTVSYGEIFSGILQDIGRAKIVGQTTLGNVEILLQYSFEDGSRAWIASEVFAPLNSDANWEKNGIIPDQQAYAPWDTITFETDPAISAALALLGHQ